MLLLFKMCQMPVKLIPAENPGSPNQKLCYYRSACLFLLCAVMHQRQVRRQRASSVPGICVCVRVRCVSVRLSQSLLHTELL